MRNLIICLVSIFILTTTCTKAQTGFSFGEPISKDTMIRNYPEPFSDVTLIEFKIENDSFVKIYVTDKFGNEIETLVSGEVERGDHFTYFRRPAKIIKGICICKMEIYLADTTEIIFTQQKIMNFDSERKYGFKK